MTPHDVTEARTRLGLTAAALGRRLELEGRDPGQQVKRWEAGKNPVPGPVRVALRYMLRDLDAQAQAARAVAALPVLDHEDAPHIVAAPGSGRTRRRG